MIVFHAGLERIDEFFIPFGGLHAGGMRSAIDCAMEKLYNHRRRKRDLTVDKIYIHKCFITPGTVVEVNDKGDAGSWKKLYYKLLENNTEYDYIKYINEFELDVVPSYCLFSTENIKILECYEMHMDLAEDILNGTHDIQYNYTYQY